MTKDRHPHRRFGVDDSDDVLLSRETAAGRIGGILGAVAGLSGTHRALVAAGGAGLAACAWWLSVPAAAHGPLRALIAGAALAALLILWVRAAEGMARAAGIRPVTALKDTAPYAAAWILAPVVDFVLQMSARAWILGGAAALTVSALYHVWRVTHHSKHQQADLSSPSDERSDAGGWVWGSAGWKITRGGETRNAAVPEKAPIQGRVQAGERTDLWIAAATLQSGAASWNVTIRPQGSDAITVGSVLDPRNNSSDRSWHEMLTPVPAGDCAFEASGGPAVACSVRPLARRSRPRKVILIVIDGVPGNRPGFAGGAADVTPRLDELAKDSLVFTRAYSQGNWTLPSFMSMLTSEHPSRHRVFHPRKIHRLSEAVPTLGDRFRSEGFATRAFFTHKRLVPHYGFARGFDVHRHAQCDRAAGRGTADEVACAALDALDFHRDHDLFLMLHFFDAHEPWQPRPGYAGRFAPHRRGDVSESEKIQGLSSGRAEREEALRGMRASLDEELRRIDVRVGAILGSLKAAGHYDDAVIAVTADHGTRLADPDRLTAYSLMDESVHVPLVIKYPSASGVGAARQDRLAAAGVDLGPTLLDAAGVTPAGRALGAGTVLRPQAAPDRECVFSEQIYHGRYSLRARTREHLCVWTCALEDLERRAPGAELPAGAESWHDPENPDETVTVPAPAAAETIRRAMRTHAAGAFCKGENPS